MAARVMPACQPDADGQHRPHPHSVPQAEPPPPESDSEQPVGYYTDRGMLQVKDKRARR